MGSNKSSSSTAGPEAGKPQKAQSDNIQRDAPPASMPHDSPPAPLQPKPQSLPQRTQQTLGLMAHRGPQPVGLPPQGLVPQGLPPAPESVQPAPECLQPPCLVPQPSPECLQSQRLMPQVPPSPDPVRFSSLGFRPEPVPEEKASSSACALGTRHLPACQGKSSQEQYTLSDPSEVGAHVRDILGSSTNSSKSKQSPNKNQASQAHSGQGFPPPPPKVVGFSQPLDTLQGNAEPRKVPLFPLPGEAAASRPLLQSNRLSLDESLLRDAGAGSLLRACCGKLGLPDFLDFGCSFGRLPSTSVAQRESQRSSRVSSPFTAFPLNMAGNA